MEFMFFIGVLIVIILIDGSCMDVFVISIMLGNVNMIRFIKVNWMMEWESLGGFGFSFIVICNLFLVDNLLVLIYDMWMLGKNLMIVIKNIWDIFKEIGGWDEMSIFVFVSFGISFVVICSKYDFEYIVFIFG